MNPRLYPSIPDPTEADAALDLDRLYARGESLRPMLRLLAAALRENKMHISDWCETDIAIRESCRKILGASVDGDSQCVPTIESLVEQVVAENARLRAAYDAATKMERQRIRNILWKTPMLPIEAPDVEAQRRLTHFICRIDEQIQGIAAIVPPAPTPPDPVPMPIASPFANTAFHGKQGPPDYSRPPSLTPPAVVQMPGQMGAPDGLPMGEPAPESLATEDANLRNLEVPR